MTVQALYDEFQKKCALDPELRALKQKIESGSTDFNDTAAYSQRVSKLLGKTLSKHIDGIPVGSREQICKWLLQEQYKDTNSICDVVQKALDEAQGIHLNPVKPKFPAERVQQVAHALEDPTVKPEVIQRRANAPVANVSMSFHDNYIRENAKIRAKLGMKPTITRYGSGCCTWCSEVAGRYKFGDQPKDIFRRHDNCDCTIIYDNQVLRGRETSSGRSKTWEEVDPKSVEKLGFTPTVHTQEQAAALQEQMYLQFRQLQYDANNPIADKRNIDFQLWRVTTAQNTIYVSDGARKAAKPKQIHAVDTHLSEVSKMMGIQDREQLPPVHVLDGIEMGSSAVASYNPIKNTLNLNLAVSTYEKENVPVGMEIFVGYKDDRSSYLHELFHWQDAEKYRRRYGEITEENYSNYVDFINQEAKKKLDKLMEKGYNITEISDYALDQYRKGKYYETYTEYRVSDLLRK